MLAEGVNRSHDHVERLIARGDERTDIDSGHNDPRSPATWWDRLILLCSARTLPGMVRAVITASENSGKPEETHQVVDRLEADSALAVLWAFGLRKTNCAAR